MIVVGGIEVVCVLDIDELIIGLIVFVFGILFFELVIVVMVLICC